MKAKLMQLLLVNVLTCGLEICMAMGTTSIPPLLLEAGLQEQFMTMVLGVGPVLGLVFVPLIGMASDRWNGRFGRRRPFIWVLCVGVLLSLLLIPRAALLARLFPWSPHWAEVLLLVCGVCLLEFCGQACFTPLEALVSDLFPGEEESRKAFSVYSLMISLGGCVGYLLPAVDWNTRGVALYLGSQEAFIYTLLTVIFLISLLSTIFISEGHRVSSLKGLDDDSDPAQKTRRCCPQFLLHPQHVCRSLINSFLLLPRIYQPCQHIPLVIRRLFVAELCSWMALMTFMLFYTDFIGEGLYQGVPTALSGTQERLQYDEGVRMGSLGLFLQGFMSVVLSFVMDSLVAWLGTKAVYLSSIVVLTVATLVMSLSSNVVLVTLMAMMTGYTFCTLQVLPYSLTCLYHSNKSVFFSSFKSRSDSVTENTIEPPNGSKQTYNTMHPGGILQSDSTPLELTGVHLNSLLVPIPLDLPLSASLPPPSAPPRGLCLDIAILDSAYLLSQVVPSLFMGFIVQLTHSVTAYMVCATGFSLLAIYFSRWVIFSKVDLE